MYRTVPLDVQDSTTHPEVQQCTSYVRPHPTMSILQVELHPLSDPAIYARILPDDLLPGKLQILRAFPLRAITRPFRNQFSGGAAAVVELSPVPRVAEGVPTAGFEPPRAEFPAPIRLPFQGKPSIVTRQWSVDCTFGQCILPTHVALRRTL
jgi:hypothetical protein